MYERDIKQIRILFSDKSLELTFIYCMFSFTTEFGKNQRETSKHRFQIYIKMYIHLSETYSNYQKYVTFQQLITKYITLQIIMSLQKFKKPT